MIKGFPSISFFFLANFTEKEKKIMEEISDKFAIVWHWKKADGPEKNEKKST